jgi:hypothetical protein
MHYIYYVYVNRILTTRHLLVEAVVVEVVVVVAQHHLDLQLDLKLYQVLTTTL